MRRILSLPGLAVAVSASCLAFERLPAVMAAVGAWHPHFLPVAPVLAIVMVAGLGPVGGASWRIARGPGRERAPGWLLIGAAPRRAALVPGRPFLPRLCGRIGEEHGPRSPAEAARPPALRVASR